MKLAGAKHKRQAGSDVDDTKPSLPDGEAPRATPEDVVRHISRTYPHRDSQVRTLAALLSPLHTSPPTIVVHGPRDAGKSTIVREALRCLDDGLDLPTSPPATQNAEEEKQASDIKPSVKKTSRTKTEKEGEEEEEESTKEQEQQISGPGELLGIKTRSQTRRSGGDSAAEIKGKTGKRTLREGKDGHRRKRRRSSSADSSRTSPDPLASDGARHLRSPTRALPHAVINCAECLTTRHLLMKIVSRSASALSHLPFSTSTNENQSANLRPKRASASSHVKCDHISQLPSVYHGILSTKSWRSRKFVLVLKGIDELRESGNTAHMLVAGLARTAMLVPELTVLLILNHAPRPLFTHAAGAPHIYFPPFNREASISIISNRSPPSIETSANDDGDDEDVQARKALLAEIYPNFVGLVYDALIGPTGGTLPVFQRVCEQLWPQFVAPVLQGEKPGGGEYDVEWDFSRLFIRNRALFQTKGEEFLVHHLVGEDRVSKPQDNEDRATKAPSSNVSSTLPRLPYLSTLILIAAFLAAHTPPRLDMTFFSKYTDSKKKRLGGRRKKRTTSIAVRDNDDDADDTSAPSSPKKGGAGNSNTASTVNAASLSSLSQSSSSHPRPFSLERLLAILHSIDPNSQIDSAFPTIMEKQPPLADAVFAELATLQRLRLLVPATGGNATSTSTMDVVDSVERWVFNAGNPAGGNGSRSAVGGGGRAGNAWIQALAKGVGIDIEDHLPNGL